MGMGASAAATGDQDKSYLETMVEFTKEGNDAVANKTASDLVKKWTEKRNELIKKVRGELDEAGRLKAMTMITLLQEQIYTAKGLPDNWPSEVKYEPTEGGYAASVGDHKIQLGSHFPEGQRRLVVTPLTRTCRQKIFEGSTTGKIVCFYGPPGTGKTETMKDTLKDLGYDVNVVSCTAEMTPDEIKDVLAEGKPVVLDEFDKLPEELAVKFVTDQTELTPEKKQAIGITMNKEPSVLITCQCVSLEMSVPSYALIAEIMFFCEGFLEGEEVAGKLANLLQACREKLSKQEHYDFGLRKMKHLVAESGVQGRAGEFKDENLIVGKALFSNMYDMATPADREIVKDLVKEHFGVEVELPADAAEGDRWVRATAALGRVTKFRHASMLVNVATDEVEASATAVEEAAKAAGTTLVRVPGTMGASVDEFIGKKDGDDWSEGNFTKALREALEKKAWLMVVCGEDLSAATFETLNTLMDDNKKLVLETGEKIPLLPETRVVFVTKDGSKMSPATVSRCGTVWTE